MNPTLALGGELVRAFRATTKGEHSGARRTVGELRALAETQRAEREKAEATRAKKANAAADAARQRHLTKLARDVESAWSKLEKLVEASDYDVAVKLAIDLRDLATRDATAPAFARRFEALRKRHLRRRGFFERWKRANESGSGERVRRAGQESGSGERVRRAGESMSARKKRTGIEWVGGLVSMPAYVTGEGEPYRPEALFWMGAEGAVLGHTVGKPGELRELDEARLRATRCSTWPVRRRSTRRPASRAVRKPISKPFQPKGMTGYRRCANGSLF